MQKKTNTKIVLIGLMISTFLSAIEGTIVSTAIPKIASDLGGVQKISWVVSIYLLSMVVTTPIFGKISDLFGRKPVFMIGTVVFLLGSILSGLSQTMEQLIIFRAIQGIGAGALIPVTFTIIGDVFQFEQRAKIQGLISAMWGVAGILGPLTGGLLVDYVSWRWIFYFNLPFGILSLILILSALQEGFERKKHHIDYWGALAFTLSMTCFLYALLEGGSAFPWDSPMIISLFSISAILGIIFFYIEWKSPEPMLPLKLFSNRIIAVVNLSGFLISFVLVAISFYIPLWVQGVYGEGATFSGLIIVPMTITWPLSAALCGKFITKYGIRAITLWGITLIICSSISLAIASAYLPMHWVLAVLMGGFGLGFGFLFTTMTFSVQSAVGWNLRGIAIASNQFLRTLGQTIGIAVFGLLLNTGIVRHMSKDLALQMDMNKALSPEYASTLPQNILQGYRSALASSLHLVFIVIAVIALVSFLIILALPKGRPVVKEHI
ncbi:MFS transporter [Paenibacillus psychroresistens]|uniref:MFS transporter n=1 Tax=Paenibacillus psychroresistens TaxID=1778678 RepID=A0A6B8RDN3_9BACL|nr:MDR family MFS transporter [Paenibacillus psychroresistens]QGQ93568.1 MFS transporter [Paenibacillus psychroresistens]